MEKPKQFYVQLLKKIEDSHYEYKKDFMMMGYPEEEDISKLSKAERKRKQDTDMYLAMYEVKASIKHLVDENGDTVVGYINVTETIKSAYGVILDEPDIHTSQISFIDALKRYETPTYEFLMGFGLVEHLEESNS